ncbi:MAG TPA: hypothetical protein VLG46_04725, partial [Anaerolineae bacterium]|nr:hypothetical protein [Anaerolineae bacterium]
MRKSILLKVASLGFAIMLIVLAVFALSSTSTAGLPPLQPVPDYLKVFPEPGQAVHLSLAVQTDQISHWGIPGYVCVKLDLVNLRQADDVFTFDSVEAATGLTIDGQEAKETEILLHGQMPPTNGPYFICWRGPISFGRHTVTLTFWDQSYSWWYELRY